MIGIAIAVVLYGLGVIGFAMLLADTAAPPWVPLTWPYQVALDVWRAVREALIEPAICRVFGHDWHPWEPNPSMARTCRRCERFDDLEKGWRP